MLTDEQAAATSTGKLRAQCERLANNDDEMREIIERGYTLKWSKGKLSLYKEGKATHGPDARKEPACPTCEGSGGLAFDATGGMSVGCPDCDETGQRLTPGELSELRAAQDEAREQRRANWSRIYGRA